MAQRDLYFYLRPERRVLAVACGCALLLSAALGGGAVAALASTPPVTLPTDELPAVLDFAVDRGAVSLQSAAATSAGSRLSSTTRLRPVRLAA